MRAIGLRKAMARADATFFRSFSPRQSCYRWSGVISILLGASGAALVSYLLRDEGFQAVITVNAVLLATLFSAGVGLFFGIYPAQRAAALNPIDALRYE